MKVSSVKESTMSANDVIHGIYNEFKKRRREYDFPIISSVYNEYDEHEGRTYSIAFSHTKAIKVGNCLVTIGKGTCIRLDEIGNCLEIIPLPKGKRVEEFIADIKDFKSIHYAVLFSSKGRLQIPKSIDSTIKFITKPSNIATKRHDGCCKITLYESTVECYDEAFLSSLITALEIFVGLSNKRTNKLKDVISAETAKQNCVNRSVHSDISHKLSDLVEQLEVRIDMYGEIEYIDLCQTLNGVIAQHNEIRSY